jgi:hypothetical protein
MTSSIMRVISRRTSSWARRGGRSADAAHRLAQHVADQRQPGQIVDREHVGAQAVVDVVGVVGDVVGDGADLRLGARMAPQLQIV